MKHPLLAGLSLIMIASGWGEVAYGQTQAPVWKADAGLGACNVSKFYEESGQRIDIQFRDPSRASVFLTSERNQIDVEQPNIKASVTADNTNLGLINPFILSPRKVVFEVFDAPAFLNKLNGSSRLNLQAGVQKWVFNAPSANGLSEAYNNCFPNARIQNAQPNTPPAPQLTPAPIAQTMIAEAAAPAATSLAAASKTSATVAKESGGLLSFIGDVFSTGDGSDAGGFERVSRFAPAETSATITPAPQPTQALAQAYSAPAMPKSIARKGQPDLRLRATEFAPVTTSVNTIAPQNMTRASHAMPQILDIGQSCGGTATLPPALAPLASYIADGRGNENTDRELIDSLKQKMLLLEREKESLRSAQPEQPSALSLVRVCTQEKTEMTVLEQRLERLEARTFELSQQQLQDKIAFEDAGANDQQEEIKELEEENEQMRQRMQELQAELNKKAVEEPKPVSVQDEMQDDINEPNDP